MTSIWVVEHGSYDDYSVDVAFTNKAAADTYAERMNALDPRGAEYEPYTVNEWDVLDECPEMYPTFRLTKFKDVGRDFRKEDLDPIGVSEDHPVELTVELLHRKPGVSTDEDILQVMGPDREEVINAFWDKLQELGW